MVVKKTVKKAPAKKAPAKKTVAKKPTVTVETKKITSSDTCSTNSCSTFGKIIILLLLIANTVLVSLVLVNQTKMEALRAGGKENYDLLKQVFQTDGYKMQQKQQLEQALQVLAQPQQAINAQANQALELAPEQQ